MESYSAFINENVDNLLLNMFKKFTYADMITYLKGLCINYLDIYAYKKLVSKFEEKDFTFIYNQIKSKVTKEEREHLELCMKIIKKNDANV